MHFDSAAYRALAYGLCDRSSFTLHTWSWDDVFTGDLSHDLPDKPLGFLR